MDFVGNAVALDGDDIIMEAQRLGCEPAAIWAVCDVESDGSGFLKDKRPKILFEAKYFHTLTGGHYDSSHPNISSSYWNRKLYGKSGAHQYDRLAVAISLDREAALESASWGKFQIMGANHKICGYTDIEIFVSDMMDDEANHLKAFGEFCKSNNIVRDLINHDWAHFTLRYNGSGNIPDYVRKLSAAYSRRLHTTPIFPTVTLSLGSQGSDVIKLQINLTNLGYALSADGDFGAKTQKAVKEFQKKYNLKADGIVGPVTANIIAIAVKNLS